MGFSRADIPKQAAFRSRGSVETLQLSLTREAARGRGRLFRARARVGRTSKSFSARQLHSAQANSRGGVMVTPPTSDARGPASRLRMRAGIVLIALGLLGHLYAAHAIGGSRVAYTHHVFGFFLILVVSGAIIAALGWRFWRFPSGYHGPDRRRGAGALWPPGGRRAIPCGPGRVGARSVGQPPNYELCLAADRGGPPQGVPKRQASRGARARTCTNKASAAERRR